MTFQLLKGNSLELLPTLAENSIDAIVTDPPYELGFMGKKWDANGIAYNVELWQQCLRVLKPGGHLLAFGGTRTYHRMTVAIEDAGFQIRDSIHWLYGSGFPKSLNVSKAIDKQRNDREDIEKVVRWMEATRQCSGVTRPQVEEAFGTVNIGQAFFTITPGSVPRVPTLEQVSVLLDLFGLSLDDVPDDIRRLLWDLNSRKGQPGENWFKREIVGTKKTSLLAVAPGEGRNRPQISLPITAPATDDAKLWEGWGTALKPAHEPIVLARKPLQGTVANNVLEHGTGALNIDETRVKNLENQNLWPANIILNEEIAEQNPEWSNYFYCSKPSKKERNAGLETQNIHPTVKPLALMRYLIRLITPPEGTVLDPFAGSGTTLAAAIQENKNAIGIELTEDYWPIIEARCEWAKQNLNQPTKPAQPTPTDYQPELPL